MQGVGVTEENARDRVRWRQMICCGDPQREQPKDREDQFYLHHFILFLRHCSYSCHSSSDQGCLKSGACNYQSPNSPTPILIFLVPQYIHQHSALYRSVCLVLSLLACGFLCLTLFHGLYLALLGHLIFAYLIIIFFLFQL